MDSAWKHANKAKDLAKGAAEMVISAQNEAMEARRILEDHDIVGMEKESQIDVNRELAVSQLEHSAVPWQLCFLLAPAARAHHARTPVVAGAAGGRFRLRQ